MNRYLFALCFVLSCFVNGNDDTIAIMPISATISTFAGVYYGTSGNGEYSGDGGPATSAYFYYTGGLFINTQGITYVTDSGNLRIRQIDASGIVNAYFGTGGNSMSGNGGAATSAAGRPAGLFGDSMGNIYFIDNQDNSVVRKIDSNNIVYLFAGIASGTGTLDDGVAATSTYLNIVNSINIDTMGDLYLAVMGDNVITKITVSTNIITVFAGTGGVASPDTSSNDGDGGPATSALLYRPYSMFLDTSGTLYFSQQYDGFLRKVTTSGIVSWVGGTGSTGYSGNGDIITTATQIQYYAYLAGNEEGYLFYGAQLDQNIRYIDPHMYIDQFAGTNDAHGYSGDGGAATAATIYHPSFMYFYKNSLYLCDTYNDVIRRMLLNNVTSAPTMLPVIAPSSMPSSQPTSSPTFDGNLVAINSIGTHSKKLSVGASVGIAFGVFSVVSIAVMYYFYRQRRQPLAEKYDSVITVENREMIQLSNITDV